ncbi:MAG: hypothetical protein R3F11_10170 [Verrucomicrobiales bacterium]
MKLIRFGNPGEEQPGVLLPSGRMIDATEFAFEYDEDFFAEDGLDRLTAWVESMGTPRRRSYWTRLRIAGRPTEQDHLRRLELPEACGGNRRGHPDRAGALHEGEFGAVRPV